MRLPLLLILPLLILDALVDWYICRAVWRRCKRHAAFWRPVALWSSIFLALVLTATILWPKRAGSNTQLVDIMWVLYAYFTIYLPKYIFVLVDALGAIPRLWHKPRIKGFTAAGAALGLFVFGCMWWGALINRYKLDVREVEFVDKNLPATFDGMTILQISDLHTGTFSTDTTFVAELVDRINDLKPDAIVFTGDVVNRQSSELLPFTGPLSRLSAPLGVYSILGNHDYGDYYQWPSEAAKADNMRLLTDTQKAMGWRMLNNEHATLYAGPDSLVIIGVENIGDPPFPVYGDLDAAYPTLDDPAFKILLSHNPAHWVNDIKDSPDKNIALTLAGHTHAMQIEVFGWSPAVFRYPTWGGMYTDGDGHSLYVNIGAGEVGIPARIGAAPELTLFTLRRAE